MRPRRIAIAVALTTAVAVGSWATSSGAQEGAFVNGTAKATALVSRIAPGVGSLQLALGAGSAVSEIRNGLAQAQATAADLGLIGTTLTAEGCDGGEGTLSPDQLPQPLRIDNRKGNAEASADEIPIGGATFGGGRKEVSATDEPAAHAVATSSAVNLAPIFTIGGGTADAVTRIVDGNAREAIATSTASIDIAGVLQLEGMTWRAFHRTGANPSVEGTFDIGSAAGQTSPLGITALEPTEPAINEALAPSGISITFPKVVHITEPADIIRVTPMRILLKDTPAGATALRPILDATREQRQQLFTQLAESFCQSAGALLVGDVALTIAAGAGFLAIDLGGVEAMTADVTFEDPFGAFTPNTNTANVLPASGSNLPASGGTALPATTPSATGGIASGAAPPVANTGPIEKACESVNPVGWPPCSHGAAIPLGLLGISLTAGMAGVDVLYQRRKAAVFA